MRPVIIERFEPMLLLQACVFTLGTVIRVVQFSFERSFWYDELWVALNLQGRSYTDLIRPLGHNQAAPFGFLVVSKALLDGGHHEQFARLAPLICGVLSMALFYWLCRTLFAPAAQTLALAIIALNPRLIYYSNELKPYSSDVTVALALLLVTVWIHRRGLTATRAVVLASSGVAALWCSFPALFVLAGVGTASWLAAWREKRIGAVRLWSVIGATWMLNILVYYLVALRTISRNQRLHDYWADGFVKFPPTSTADLIQAIWVVPHAIEWLAGLGLAHVPVVLVTTASMIGCRALWLRAHTVCLVLISPLLMAVAAALLDIYPFSGRLVLFLIPVFTCLFVEGVGHIWHGSGRRARFVVAVVTAGILAQPFSDALSLMRTPQGTEETERLFGRVKPMLQAEDRFFVHYYAEGAFRYYGPHYGFDRHSTIFGVSWRNDMSEHRRALQQIGAGRVWVIFSHVRADQRTSILKYLDGIGRRAVTLTEPGCSAHLYVMRSPSM